LAAAQRPTSNEDSLTDRRALLGGLRRSFVTAARYPRGPASVKSEPASEWSQSAFLLP
jgi:hypothetical protein